MVITVIILAFLSVLIWPPREALSANELVARRAARVEAGLLARARRILRHEWTRQTRDASWVADYAELTAVSLDAGLPTAEAIELATEIGDHGERLQAVEADKGLPDERSNVRFLAAAWALTEELGVPAAPAARVAAGAVRERVGAAQRRSVLLAGPTASMRLLTILPLLGPVVVLLLGVDPREVYGNSIGLGVALVGLMLTVAGWWWSRHLLQRAVRPMREILAPSPRVSSNVTVNSEANSAVIDRVVVEGRNA